MKKKLSLGAWAMLAGLALAAAVAFFHIGIPW